MNKLRALFASSLVLFAASAARAASILPQGLCAELRAPGAEEQALARRAAPDLAEAGLKELGGSTTLTIIGWAQSKKLSGLELFTDEGFRADCVYYLSRPTLEAVDKRYDLDLASQISGSDTDGKPFQMAALIVGRGKLVAVYDSDETRYHNDRYDRDFKMSRVVRFNAPEPGRLDEIEGLWAHAGLLGWLGMHEFKKSGDHTVKVNVGGFVKESPLRPITARGSVESTASRGPSSEEPLVPEQGAALQELRSWPAAFPGN